MSKVISFVKNYRKEISVLIFIMALVVLMIPLFSVGFDYWWHIKTGEYIVSTGSIPKMDIFSWYGVTQGLPWISHEWLSEVILVGFRFLFGTNHIFIYIVTFIFLTIFSLYLFLRKEMNKNILATACFLMFGCFLLGPTLTPRPHLISNLLFVVSLFLVFDLYNNENSKKIYFLPIIAILWANLHGGSSNLTYILCFIFSFLGLFSVKFLKIYSSKLSPIQWKKFFLIGILCMLAITLNPHGLEMLWYPYHNIMDNFMKSLISEWRVLSIFRVSDLPFFCLAILSFVYLFVTNKKKEFIPLMILIIFFYLALNGVRFVPYFYFVVSFVLFKNIAPSRESKYLPLIFTIAGIILIAVGIINYSKTISQLQDPLLPDSVISYLKESPPRRLFNYYDYGGYLIYNDIDVFVDGRADVYSSHNLRDFKELSNAGDKTEFLLGYYQFDYILIPNNIGLYTFLAYRDDYVKVLEDNNIFLYKRVMD